MTRFILEGLRPYAKSVVLRSYTIHELRNRSVSMLVSSTVSSNNYVLCFVHNQGHKM